MTRTATARSRPAQSKLVAAEVFTRYATSFAANGGDPDVDPRAPRPADRRRRPGSCRRPVGAGPDLDASASPPSLSGGVTWRPTQINPKDMALAELLALTESRIAVLLGVPPFLVGLPSGGDPMTYSNVTSIFDYHWRAGLRPQAAGRDGRRCRGGWCRGGRGWRSTGTRTCSPSRRCARRPRRSTTRSATRRPGRR